MAWIHGGGFQEGSAAIPLDDGATLAAFGDVVVVTIEYRLQSFGFLYDETSAPRKHGFARPAAGAEMDPRKHRRIRR
ncbi:hypothetical protein MTO96_005956 [Rhipicephalus appendiculatus]